MLLLSGDSLTGFQFGWFRCLLFL